MASRIKGITVEIGGDTTKLEQSLKSVNSTIKSTQSERFPEKPSIEADLSEEIAYTYHLLENIRDGWKRVQTKG